MYASESKIFYRCQMCVVTQLILKLDNKFENGSQMKMTNQALSKTNGKSYREIETHSNNKKGQQRKMKSVMMWDLCSVIFAIPGNKI